MARTNCSSPDIQKLIEELEHESPQLFRIQGQPQPSQLMLTLPQQPTTNHLDPEPAVPMQGTQPPTKTPQRSSGKPGACKLYKLMGHHKTLTVKTRRVAAESSETKIRKTPSPGHSTASFIKRSARNPDMTVRERIKFIRDMVSEELLHIVRAQPQKMRITVSLEADNFDATVIIK